MMFVADTSANTMYVMFQHVSIIAVHGHPLSFVILVMLDQFRMARQTRLNVLCGMIPFRMFGCQQKTQN